MRFVCRAINCCVYILLFDLIIRLAGWMVVTCICVLLSQCQSVFVILLFKYTATKQHSDKLLCAQSPHLGCANVRFSFTTNLLKWASSVHFASADRIPSRFLLFFTHLITKTINMSGNAFKNIEESLKKHLPNDELKEVKRILYGRSDEWVYFVILYSFNLIPTSLQWKTTT